MEARPAVPAAMAPSTVTNTDSTRALSIIERATTVTLVLRTEAFDHTGRPCFTIALDDHN
ncbi:hypothetical protein SAMN06295924_1163 [Rathayibacter rathayi NCPPB 2980 = VKM Ac-1601]|nr:hypothetical protein SAMN06295924_1163 [Rathayibacter rathayi NCPPB 2980 = VKM Ac-1601]